MSSKAARRKWFRFHLATLIAITFAAALLLWANVHEHSDANGVRRGFPFPMYWKLQMQWSGFQFMGHNSYARVGPFRFNYQDNGWCVGLIILNALIGAAAIGFVALLSEFLIRRRENALS